MKTTPLVALMSVLAVSGVSALNLSEVEPDCQDHNSGPGWEEETCTFSCEMGQRVHISVTVDDEGAVNGEATCGGITATCGDVDGDCHGQREPAAASSKMGSCWGEGYGGTGPFTWTRVNIHCWADGTPRKTEVDLAPLLERLKEAFSDDPGIEINALEAAKRALRNVDNDGLPTIDDLGLTSLVYMFAPSDDRLVGVSCLAGKGCEPFVPVCALTESAWRCGTPGTN